MHRQNAPLPNPLVAELLELDAGTPVRLTFRHISNVRGADRIVRPLELEPYVVEAYLEGLGRMFGDAGDVDPGQPLAVRYRFPSNRYDHGRDVADLVAVEVLDAIAVECATCKARFPVTTKMAPRECPTCAAKTQEAGRAAVAAFPVGARVELHAFGHWYAGEVVKAGRSTVTVRYTTGTGVTRDKTVNAAGDLVRLPGMVKA